MLDHVQYLLFESIKSQVNMTVWKSHSSPMIKLTNHIHEALDCTYDSSKLKLDGCNLNFS